MSDGARRLGINSLSRTGQTKKNRVRRSSRLQPPDFQVLHARVDFERRV